MHMLATHIHAILTVSSAVLLSILQCETNTKNIIIIMSCNNRIRLSRWENFRIIYKSPHKLNSNSLGCESV